jgi:hypothetical protein
MMICSRTIGLCTKENGGRDGSAILSSMAAANASARGQRHAILASFAS